MLPNRYRISKRATDTLKQLKSRTGVTPNILCRMALALSLRDGLTATRKVGDLDGSEFNLPTLFGENSLAYEALLVQVHGPMDAKEIQAVVASHIDAGVEQLKRAKTTSDLLSFESKAQPSRTS